jgi:hypothetical protein
MASTSGLVRWYVTWCAQMEVSVDAFADELDRVREIPELGGNIRKRGARYYGITVGDVPKLPSE